MAMNEKDVMKRSLKLGAILLSVFIAVGIVTHDISYPLGYLLGYVVNLFVFLITIYTSTEILKIKVSVIPVVISVILKMVLLALGFFIAIKVSYINIIGVFVGYLTTKISILIEGYMQKGGDVHKWK